MKNLSMIFGLLIFVNSFVIAQNKQGNTTGGEIFADAPYRIQKHDTSGVLNGIPIHFFCHDADGFGSNFELMNIRISLKNAEDSIFDSPITFATYTDSAFNMLFICKSQDDTVLDIQDFDNSGAIKDASHTINFTSDSHVFPATTYVDITQKYWYVTFIIPPEKLNGYNDIIDIEVYFELDWATDHKTHLRVFRQNQDYPNLANWYRGDTHYHTLYTQNLAEIGLPLNATKLAAKCVELDWITTTDHSCDFDNYGSSMLDNWARLNNEVQSLNIEDSSFIFIHGIEMSINNSDNKIVHALVYPNPQAPFSLPYIGDGGGDASGTNVTINSMLDSLLSHNAFCYAAHPFAELDKLSWAISGNVWSISDTAFPENGQAHPSTGTVICNDPSSTSDVYFVGNNKLFKDKLVGFQIWNLRNELETSSNSENPWDVEYTNSGFNTINNQDTKHHCIRFQQNFDVIEHLWKRGLVEKTQSPNIDNWKVFISAGSDAHGSYNFSNTDLYYGIFGSITDNAIGKLSTLTLYPNGMGSNGENILLALKNGNTILSSGPIINMGISTQTPDSIIDISIGEDSVLDYSNISNYNLIINSISNSNFGDISDIKLITGTKDSIYTYNLPIVSGVQTFNVGVILNSIFGTGQIPLNEYFYLRAELNTFKNYDTLSVIYKRQNEIFRSYTNPIWINLNSYTKIDNAEVDKIEIFPNPNRGIFNIVGNNITDFFIYNNQGALIEENHKKSNSHKIDISNHPKGVYLIKIIAENYVVSKKLVYN